MTDTDTPAPRWLEYIPLGELPEDDRNPKNHADIDIEASMGRWGYTEPVMFDERTGKLIAGHGRKGALLRRQQLGEPAPDGIVDRDGVWLVPVVRGWSSTSDEEAAGYLVAANQLTIAGGWNPDPLAAILELHRTAGTLDGLGFGSAEAVDDLLAELRQTVPDFAPSDEDQPRLDRKFHLVCNNCGAAVDPASAERIDQ